MDLIRKLKKALFNANLSEEEVAIYLNILKHPESSIYELSKICKIPKDRAYRIIDTLADKKLIEAEGDRNKKIKATTLQNFIEDIQSQGRDLYKNAQSLKEIKNSLRFLQAPEQEDTIKFIPHEEIGDHFYDLTYFNWDHVYAYGNFEMVISTAMTSEQDQKFVDRRVKKGRKALPIFVNPGPICEKIINADKNEIRESKVIFDKRMDNSFVVVLPEINKVSIWHKDPSSQRISGNLISSPTATKTHKAIFDHFWKLSKYTDFSNPEK